MFCLIESDQSHPSSGFHVCGPIPEKIKYRSRCSRNECPFVKKKKERKGCGLQIGLLPLDEYQPAVLPSGHLGLAGDSKEIEVSFIESGHFGAHHELSHSWVQQKT